MAVQEWPRLRVRYGLELHDEAATAGDAARSFASTASANGGRTFDAGVAGDLGWRNLFGRAVSAGIAGRYTPGFRAARVYGTSWLAEVKREGVENYYPALEMPR